MGNAKVGSWPTVLSGVRAALRPLKNSWFRRTSASWNRAILTLSAISCPWRLHLNFSCQVESNGWFSAIKLIARISGPGHQLPVAVTSKFLVPGGIEWLVFGDQVDRENFGTRPGAGTHGSLKSVD